MTRRAERGGPASALPWRSGLAGVLAIAALTGGCASLAPPAPVPAPPAANAAWEPPAELAPRPVPLPRAEIPAELMGAAAGKEMELSLPQVIDLALRNSSATQETWAAAHSAAAEVGSRAAAYFPTADLSAEGERVRQSAVGNQFKYQITDYGASLNLSYLLFDFGVRKADVAEARQLLVAADWDHNAALQEVVLEVETAYFRYLTAKALRSAEEASLREAQTNLQAAEDRHQAGVATIADVLQAKTRLAQAQLVLQQVVGQMQATRGGLATAMGLPANLPVETGELPAEVPAATAAAIDTILGKAISERPDLEAARARATAADRKVERVRAEGRPQLELNGRLNRTYYDIAGSTPSDNYSAQLLLSFPLFTGYRHHYDLEEAKADAASAHASAGDLQQRVMVQVWNSYYDLQTAAQNVTTAGDLLSSAQQSEEVAAGRYKAGVGSILDLLVAQSALADARAQQIQARADWLLALAQLAHDTGALGPRPPTEPSQLTDHSEEGSHAEP